MGHRRGNYSLHDHRLTLIADIADDDTIQVRHQLSRKITKARPEQLPARASNRNTSTSSVTVSAPEPFLLAADTRPLRIVPTHSISFRT